MSIIDLASSSAHLIRIYQISRTSLYLPDVGIVVLMRLFFLLGMHCVATAQIVSTVGTVPAVGISAVKIIDTCRKCPLPVVARGDSVINVLFTDGTFRQNCISAKREVFQSFNGFEQGIRLTFLQSNGQCVDTVVAIGSVEQFMTISIGGRPPYVIPIRPAREFTFVKNSSIPSSFFELTGGVGYGGKDKSIQQIGSAIFLNADIMISPLGSLLGDAFAIVVGGGVMSEGARTRLKAQGQLRFTLSGTRTLIDSAKYYPDPCRFEFRARPSEVSKHIPPPSDYNERVLPVATDSSSYFLQTRTYNSDAIWRPYFFVTGGTFFDMNFEGGGSEPALNPQDYRQFFIDAGIGVVWNNVITINLAYRYMRLNLRTDCPTCPQYKIVNTNFVHGIHLNGGLRLEW
jgi:hypothetical protein